MHTKSKMEFQEEECERQFQAGNVLEVGVVEGRM